MGLLALRIDWVRHVDDLDAIIDAVQMDGRIVDEIGAAADNAVDARRAWLSTLQEWRLQVEALLAKYPEPRGG